MAGRDNEPMSGACPWAKTLHIAFVARRLCRDSIPSMQTASLSGLWFWLGFETWRGPRHGWLNVQPL
jgi:hypothetical protein